VWAHCKGYVARKYDNKRTMAGTAEQLQHAMRSTHPASEWAHLNCAALIAHCEKEILADAQQSGMCQDHKDDIRCILPLEDDDFPDTTSQDAAEEGQLIDDGQDSDDPDD
jgi:hypothetical protein